MIRFGGWLVSGYAHVFIRLSVVIGNLPVRIKFAHLSCLAANLAFHSHMFYFVNYFVFVY